MNHRGALLDGTDPVTVRETIVRLMTCATLCELAIANVRIAAIDLGAAEFSQIGHCRLLISQLDAGFLADADALRHDVHRQLALQRLHGFTGSGRLEVRRAALARWVPDFSVYHFPAPEPPALLLGAHYFYDTNGHTPLTAVLRDTCMARRASRRFNELWVEAYDVLPSINEALGQAVRADSLADIDAA